MWERERMKMEWRKKKDGTKSRKIEEIRIKIEEEETKYK